MKIGKDWKSRNHKKSERFNEANPIQFKWPKSILEKTIISNTIKPHYGFNRLTTRRFEQAQNLNSFKILPTHLKGWQILKDLSNFYVFQISCAYNKSQFQVAIGWPLESYDCIFGSCHGWHQFIFHLFFVFLFDILRKISYIKDHQIEVHYKSLLRHPRIWDYQTEYKFIFIHLKIVKIPENSGSHFTRWVQYILNWHKQILMPINS